MSTTPPTRLTGTTDRPAPPAGAPDLSRVVTAAQVDQAVLQLRERSGQTPVELLQAVLRALDLTVAAHPAAPEPAAVR